MATIYTGARSSYTSVHDTSRVGGMAKVFQAQAEDGTVVAIKLAWSHPASVAALLTEGDMLAEVQGGARVDWLVRLLDRGTHDGRPFLVLEWLPYSLDRWVEERKPSLPDRLGALVWCCRTVLALHRHREAGCLVHRDIKPGNFLLDVDEDGGVRRLVLADLGIASEGPVLDKRTRPPLATPKYAPLEQCLQGRVASDPKFDTFALGVTVYTVLLEDYPEAVSEQRRLYRVTGREQEVLLDTNYRGRLNAGEAQRMQELLRLPLADLVNLNEMLALTRADETRLSNRILDEVPDPTDRTRVRALIEEHLMTRLSACLRPDPDYRESSAAYLLEALVKVKDALGPPRGERSGPVPVTYGAGPRGAAAALSVTVAPTPGAAAATPSVPAAPTPGSAAAPGRSDVRPWAWWGAVAGAAVSLLLAGWYTAQSADLGVSDAPMAARVDPSVGGPNPPGVAVPPAIVLEPPVPPSAGTPGASPPTAVKPAVRAPPGLPPSGKPVASPPPSAKEAPVAAPAPATPPANPPPPAPRTRTLLITFPDEHEASIKVDGRLQVEHHALDLGPGVHHLEITRKTTRTSEVVRVSFELNERAGVWTIPGVSKALDPQTVLVVSSDGGLSVE